MHTKVTFFQEPKDCQRSLIASIEREEESFYKIIFSVTFFKNLVVSLGNLRAVLEKLLWFHILGEQVLLVSGVTTIEDRLVDLDVLSPLLVVPSSSLEVCRT